MDERRDDKGWRWLEEQLSSPGAHEQRRASAELARKMENCELARTRAHDPEIKNMWAQKKQELEWQRLSGLSKREGS